MSIVACVLIRLAREEKPEMPLIYKLVYTLYLLIFIDHQAAMSDCDLSELGGESPEAVSLFNNGYLSAQSMNLSNPCCIHT